MSEPQRSEDKDVRASEIRGQRSGVRGQRSEVGGQRAKPRRSPVEHPRGDPGSTGQAEPQRSGVR